MNLQLKSITFILIFTLSLSVLSPLYAQRGAYQKETEEVKAERMEWYQDARFGMFIHWGAYSQLDGEYKGVKMTDPKGEWIMRKLEIPVDEYATEIAGKFNPKYFDADKWAKTAKDAGMKYLVMTTKHHDGFALFDSDVSNYNIVDASPFKRDVIKELSEACSKYGLKFGVYYSQAQDWYHPGGFAPDERWDKKQEGEWTDYFRTIVKGQVTELFTNYGEISLIWWDSARKTQNKDVADEVGKELVKLQPNIIVNPRLGGHEKGDFSTFEQEIPGVFKEKYNELCLTHNRSWSYKASDNDWKSPQFLLKTFVQMASMGGNFLFNVGPDQNGEFPKQTVEALKYIGDWMAVNSESIYGTEASPFYKLPFGEATLKVEEGKTKLYLQVYDWPGDKKLYVKGLNNKIANAYILGSTNKIKVYNKEEGVYIKELPKKAPHEAISVIVLEINEPLNVNPGYIKPTDNNSIKLTPNNAILTIKPQYDYIPSIVGIGDDAYFNNWRNHLPQDNFNGTRTKAHWKIEVSENSKYKVVAIVATQSSDNVVGVFAKKQHQYTIKNTGGMDNFEEIELGEVYLEEGKINTLTFGGYKREKWDYVRLRSITLEKIN